MPVVSGVAATSPGSGAGSLSPTRRPVGRVGGRLRFPLPTASPPGVLRRHGTPRFPLPHHQAPSVPTPTCRFASSGITRAPMPPSRWPRYANSKGRAGPSRRTRSSRTSGSRYTRSGGACGPAPSRHHRRRPQRRLRGGPAPGARRVLLTPAAIARLRHDWEKDVRGMLQRLLHHFEHVILYAILEQLPGRSGGGACGHGSE